MIRRKLVTLLVVAAAVCSSTSLRAEVMKTVTITVTANSQNSSSDNGTVTTIGNPIVTTLNTRTILNLLALDKQAQHQWGSSAFPSGAKLVLTNDNWLVLDSANNVLADVSDIISGGGGSHQIKSGKQNDLTQLSAPSMKTLELVRLTFDDTAIVGGNNISFYLQGVSTKTVTDTTPIAGVYTETETDSVTGAGGEGVWSNGVPFICTGNMTVSGSMKYGQTSPTTGFAPASLAGYAGTVSVNGKQAIVISWGQATFGQTGFGSDTNADDFCAGIYTYVKTGPNTARMASSDIGMLSWLGTSNYTTVNITFTSSTAASCVVSNSDGLGSATIALSHVNNLVAATLAGKTVHASDGGKGTVISFDGNGTFTETKSGIVTGTGTYTFMQFSPTIAIVEQVYVTGSDQGALSVAEVIFTSSTGGRVYHSFYQNPTEGANPDNTGMGTFTIQ